MTRLERLDDYLKKYGLFPLDEIPDNEETNIDFFPLEYLKLLENKLEHFSYDEDISYLYGIFPRLSFFLENDIEPLTDGKKRNIQEMLDVIHEKIQILLITKPGNINKKEVGYQCLLKLINKVENLSLSYLYDFVEHYKDIHVDLLEYLIFEIKTYSLVENAIHKYPYMVRFTDKNGVLLLEKVIAKYLEEAFDYTKEKELSLNSDLVYYDQILDLFFTSPKIKISMKTKVELIGKVEEIKRHLNANEYNNLTKRKYIFWLNNLLEKLENIDSKEMIFDFDILCYKHDVKDKFDQGLLSEANRLYHNLDINKFKNRRIVKNEYIIAIDGEEAEEIDDSLSIQKLKNGNYLIGVHIADPGGYLSIDNIIMEEAFKRTTSIYLSDKAIPMMPEILSKDIFSLVANQDRLATSYYIETNPNGKIENFSFDKTIVRLNRNETYSNIDKFLKRGYADDRELDRLLELFAIINPRLSKHFNISPLYSLINRTVSNTSNTNITINSNAAKIVETNMIMTNYLIAKFFWNQKLPFVNRVHKIEPDYLEELEKKEKLLHNKDDHDIITLIQFLQKSYPRALYKIDETTHAGLGLSHYSHVTSPLRRSADILATSICIDQIYFGKLPDTSVYQLEEFLRKSCNYINDKYPTICHFEKIYEKEKIKKLN